MYNSSDIKAIILDSGIDIEEIENVKIIRIKSENNNLLICRDYWPTIGEINGSVIIEGNTSKAIENIRGFYCISRNIFHLIIKEKGNN